MRVKSRLAGTEEIAKIARYHRKSRTLSQKTNSAIGAIIVGVSLFGQPSGVSAQRLDEGTLIDGLIAQLVEKAPITSKLGYTTVTKLQLYGRSLRDYLVSNKKEFLEINGVGWAKQNGCIYRTMITTTKDARGERFVFSSHGWDTYDIKSETPPFAGGLGEFSGRVKEGDKIEITFEISNGRVFAKALDKTASVEANLQYDECRPALTS